MLSELTVLAEDPDADPELHRAVGRAIARVVMARGGFDDTLFLADFTGPAFIAFDEEVAVIAAEQDDSSG